MEKGYRIPVIPDIWEAHRICLMEAHRWEDRLWDRQWKAQRWEVKQTDLASY